MCAGLWTLALIFAVFSVKSVPVTSLRAVTVVIDAGHGGVDSGVIGRTTGVEEKVINLAIAKKIERYLSERGVFVVLTRKTDAGLYGAATKGMKKRDMLARKKIIEETSPLAVVSIHQNSFPEDTSQQGGQVFFSPNSEEGKLLAAAIQTKLNESNPFRKNKSIHVGDYYLLNSTSFPSVIVECGFLTNEEEEKLLISEEYQEKVAKSVSEGILTFLAAEKAANLSEV